MASSGVPILRPLGTGQLLDQAIRIYRRNFLKFVGIIAVMQIPLTALGLLISLVSFWNAAQADQSSTLSAAGSMTLWIAQYYAGLLRYIALGILSLFLIQGVAAAALTRAVADDYLGRPGGFLRTYGRLGRSWLRLIAALLLSIVLYIPLLIWLIVPCIGWVTGLGILVFFAQVIMPLVAPVVVLEKQGVAGSIRRAWDLARRRFWWVLGFMAILYVFNQLVVSGPGALLNTILNTWALGSSSANPSPTIYVTEIVIQSLVTLVLGLIYLPLHLTATTLLYVDLRVRTEGFDLLWRAEDTRQEGVAAVDLLPESRRPGGEGLVSGKEVGYFALMSVGIVVLVGIFYTILAVLLFALSSAFLRF